MSLLTPKLLFQIKEIIAKHHTALVAKMFGHDTVPEKVLESLKAAGLIDKNASGIEDAYLYGVAVAVAQNPAMASWSSAQLKDYVAKNPVPLTPVEHAAVQAAKLTAAQYVVGLGNVVEKETGQLLIEADHKLRAKLKEDIADETVKKIESRATVKELKSDLGHRTEDWTRNLDRIAITESHNAMQLGVAQGLAKKYGDPRVSIIPMPDACADCKRLHLGPDGKPRIFKLSQLAAPGANVKKPKSAWVASTGAVHPHCQCQLTRVPAGWGYDKDGTMVPGGAYGVEVTEKSFAILLQHEEDHLDRLEKAHRLKGRMEYDGLLIAIEQEVGDERQWKDRNGETGTTTMLWPYGFIEGTKGADGEAIDCYVGPNPEAPNVYVVDQRKKLGDGEFGGFDEQKCMIGFSSADEAREAYLAHYNDPGFLGAMRAIPFDDFKHRVMEEQAEVVLKSAQLAGPRESFVLLDDYNLDVDLEKALSHKYTTRSWSVDHWVYEYANAHAGKVSAHATDKDAFALKLPKEKAAELEAFRAKHGLPGEVIHGSQYAVLPMTNASALTAWKQHVQPTLSSGPKLTVPADQPKPTVQHVDGNVHAKVAAVQQATTKDGAPKHITLSPQFQSFFGDWVSNPASASKVVDAQGVPQEQYGEKPTVVYHGTPVGGFSSFSKEKDKGGNIFGKGFYFTEDKAIATEYTKKDEKEALASATGLRGDDGAEVTHLTKGQALKLREIITKPYPNPNWDYNFAWAIDKATDEKGRVEVSKLISEFWNPSHPEAGKTWGDTPRKNPSTHGGVMLMAKLQKITGAKAIVPESQVFETYLNIRKPVDMDALMPESEFNDFAEFTRKAQIPDALREIANAQKQLDYEQSDSRVKLHESYVVDAKEKLVAAQAKLAEEVKKRGKKKKKEWGEEHAESEVAQAQHSVDYHAAPENSVAAAIEKAKANLAHAHERHAELVAPWAGAPAIHGTYLDSLVTMDEFKKITGHHESLPITHASLLALKEHMKPLTSTHAGVTKKRMGIAHIGDQQPGKLTWGDMHWLVTNGHESRGPGSSMDHFTRWAQAKGYDGIHHTGGWNIGSHAHSVWIAFEPNQIKATTSTGFDTSSPDIYKAGAYDTLFVILEKAGPYIGPQGGKYADPAHKVAWREGHHAETTEDGVHFQTGKPVDVKYTHRKQPTQNFGPRFGQDIEPAGRYVLHGHLGTPGESTEAGNFKVTTTHGTVHFENPLVIVHGGTTGEPGGWKRRLSDEHGGKKGKALSNAIAKKGHDGIVTVDAHGTSEIVDLTHLHVAKSMRYSEVSEADHGDVDGGGAMLAAKAPMQPVYLPAVEDARFMLTETSAPDPHRMFQGKETWERPDDRTHFLFPLDTGAGQAADFKDADLDVSGNREAVEQYVGRERGGSPVGDVVKARVRRGPTAADIPS